MTQEETKKLFRMMKAMFPSMRNAATDDMEGAYWLVLKGYDYGIVRDAVIALAGKQRMYPSPSEIVELLPKKNRKADPREIAAVQRILDRPGCPMLEKHGGEPLTVGQIVERYGKECGSCEQNGRCSYRDWRDST